MSPTDPKLSPGVQKARCAIVATEILRNYSILHDAPSTEPEGDETISDSRDSWQEDAWFQQHHGQYAFETEATVEFVETFSRMDAAMAILDSYHQGRLKDRVAYLKDLAEEEVPDTEPMSITSVESFVQFLGMFPSLRCPNLVLTPQGNIRAKWKGANKKHYIALEFMDGLSVKFVVSTPDPSHTYKTTRAAGVATIDSVVDILRPYGVTHMLSDNE